MSEHCQSKMPTTTTTTTTATTIAGNLKGEQKEAMNDDRDGNDDHHKLASVVQLLP